MNIVKNQHTVAQFYLKYFADTKERIYVKKIYSEEPCFLTNVRNVAARRFFYDIPDDINSTNLKNNQTIERYLATQEAVLAEILRKNVARVEKDDGYILTEGDRKELAVFKVFQWIRTDVYRKGSVFVKQLNFPQFSKHQIEETKELIHAKEILEIDTIIEEVEFYSKFVIFLLKNNTSIPFITSDNPVAFNYLEENKEMTDALNRALNNEKVLNLNNNEVCQYGIMYFCPLTPTIGLCFYERSYLVDTKKTNFLDLDGTTTWCVEEFVKGMNNLIVTQADTQVFSNMNLDEYFS